MDTVILQVNGHIISRSGSYSVTSNLFEAADGFKFELAYPGVEINEGDLCQLFVNDQMELNGVIDKVMESGDKSGTTLKIEGRDLMGLIVDAYAEDYTDHKNEELKSLAERLLTPIKQINRKAIQYGKGSKDKAVPITDTVEEYEFTEVTPAETIFEILKRHAMSRGLLFFSLTDGTFVFGEPIKKGPAEYTFINRKDGMRNNVLEWERVQDISKQYSQVTVLGERQGTDETTQDETKVHETIINDRFPSHLYKPFVATIETDADNPKKYAKILLETQQFESFCLTYKVKGHSQGGKNFQTNKMAHVIDEKLKIDADFLVYERVFEKSRSGVYTTVKLSWPGISPA
jgi:prophage tail gpP-like protein